MLQRSFMAVLFTVAALLVWRISRVESWNLVNWLLLGVLLIDRKQDQQPYAWRTFLPRGIFLLGSFYLVYRYAPAFWGMVSSWELQSVDHLFKLNDLFRQIPYNDGAIFRFYQPEWLTGFMRWVYSYGFSLTLWLAVIRSFAVKDGKKMLGYALSTHIIQLPLILFFYMTIELQEVWFVLGHPDGMNRNFTAEQAALYVQNCFPSMHTSISFAVLLLAVRESGKIYKWVMVSYCSLVIYSTVYLEIHWVLDVFAGMLLGYAAVKISDTILQYFQTKTGLLSRPTGSAATGLVQTQDS